MDDRAAFARLVDALRPWLADVVIVGGWAHQLYRLHPLAHQPSYLPLRTQDADVAFASRAKLQGNIGQALRSANFTEQLRGEDRPPVARYVLGDDDAGFYAEFLTHLSGPAIKRDGSSNDTLSRAGVTAQRLRHLDVLLLDPWSVALSAKGGFPVAKRATVQIPNPAAFIAQKLVIHEYRAPDKRAQDILYIHDTLELFERAHDTIGEIWQNTMVGPIGRSVITKLQHARHTIFGAVTDEIRSAARIPVARNLRADRMQTFCKYGLDTIFGAHSPE